MKAPFPYFGGKSRIASSVWGRFGDVARYVEPFAGSLAVLLERPRPFGGREIVNDSDGLLVNVWRALASDPSAVAEWADWPATESDMHARHMWLVGQRDTLTARLEGDPDWFDAKAAGWWLWGIGLWIGGGWCSGTGPWRVVEDEDRQLLHAGDDGRGTARIVGWRHDTLLAAFEPLSERLRDVMIMAGDWTRVVTPAVMMGSGKGRNATAGACAIFLDPPYSEDEREGSLYAHDNAVGLADSVREWAIANGDDPRLRIALCGYDGEHTMPSSWVEVPWRTKGGYASQSKQGTRARENVGRERIWFSPHCQRVGLWDGA